ncbi:MAG: HEAT repeat domain-containing protein [Candidatus Micrarchaeota archaeon]
MDKEDEDEIIRFMQSSDQATRLLAITNAGKVKDPRVVPLLIDALRDGISIAAIALGDIGNALAVPALIEALDNEDSDIRRIAVRALGKIRDPRSIGPLIRMLGDPEYDIIEAASEALAKHGEAAVPPLIDALYTDDWDVQDGAAKALIELAKTTDIDLSRLAEALQNAFGDMKKKGDRLEGQLKREWALSTYKTIAESMKKRKQKEMPEELLPAKIKKPEKGIYRANARTRLKAPSGPGAPRWTSCAWKRPRRTPADGGP